MKFLALIIIISHYSMNRACVSTMFFALFIGATIVAASVYISGEYNRAEVFGERAAGGTPNTSSKNLDFSRLR